MSEVVEKIKADLAFWQDAMAKARETLTAGESIVPGLLESLAKLNGHPPTGDQLTEPAQPAMPSPTETTAAEPPATAPATPPETARRRRTCVEEVEAELLRNAPLSSHDLEMILAANGTPYGPGAVGYALRDLMRAGLVERVEKRGNLWFYRHAIVPKEVVTDALSRHVPAHAVQVIRGSR